MSVNLIFKIAAVGILVSVLSQVLKHSGREEQAFLTSFAGLLLVLFWIVPYIYELFESIKRVFLMSIVQAGVLGVMGALLAVQFKNGKTEYGIYMSVAISVFIFLSIVGRLEEIINTIRQISGHINMDTSYIATLIKMLGVTYIAEFASGICRDTGYQTIASQIEIFGKLTILVMSLPVLLALLQTIQEFLS